MLFECTYRGGHHAGIGRPDDAGPLRLLRLPGGPAAVRAAVLSSGGDEDVLRAVLAARGEETVVPASERGAVRFRPPLLPVNPAEAVVGGFMQTHNVKADQNPPSQPNWFLKGQGEVLRLPGEELTVPPDAVAVCEEAEIVLVHVVDGDGLPRYAGYTYGNDLTDIGRFRQHPGHLSYAKLCDAGVAPWLFTGPPPESVTGSVTIERDGAPAWQGGFSTGTKAIAYDVDGMMDRLFAHHALRRPGRVHYTFIGADRSSFHAGFRIADGDRVTLEFGAGEAELTHLVSWPGAYPGAK